MIYYELARNFHSLKLHQILNISHFSNPELDPEILFPFSYHCGTVCFVIFKKLSFILNDRSSPHLYLDTGFSKTFWTLLWSALMCSSVEKILKLKTYYQVLMADFVHSYRYFSFDDERNA